MSLNKNMPIGIFDSGVGGLTVFKALRSRLPAERLVYFGDTARLPYGSKSPEVVRRFSLEIGRFLQKRGIKLLVVACNTASALALSELRRKLKVPVLGVIVPAARAAAAASRPGRIGVIATEATVRSGAYPKALGGRVKAKACPLFVPLIEEGWWDHPVTRRVARDYLAGLKAGGVDSLILGCTHYPMIKGVLASVMGPGVRLVDSAEETAVDADELLSRLGLKRSGGKGGESFFVTDGAERYRTLVRRILGGRARRVRVVRLPG